MSETTPEVGASVPAGNVLGRFVGVLTAPRATFAAVAAHPRWLGMLALVAGVSMVCLFSFLSTETGQQALMDRVAPALERSAQNAPPEQLQRIQQFEERIPVYARWGLPVAQLVGWPISTLVIAGVLMAAFNALLGGEATFKQVLALVAHANVVLASSQLFIQPLNYVLESMSNPVNLGVLFPFLEEMSFLARLLGSINFFCLWWMAVLAIGLSVLYRRRAVPIFWGLFTVYFVLILIGAAVATAFSRSVT